MNSLACRQQSEAIGYSLAEVTATACPDSLWFLYAGGLMTKSNEEAITLLVLDDTLAVLDSTGDGIRGQKR